jgi:hypothetical protein
LLLLLLCLSRLQLGPLLLLWRRMLLLLLLRPTLRLVAAATQQFLHAARGIYPFTTGVYGRMQNLPAKHPQ